ncbi:MAG: ScpA family protein [Hyphomonadaceae bacterium]
MSDRAVMDVLSAGADQVDAGDVFTVDTDGFEGPLHMLLDMARRQKVDLLHISILDLATQYLEFIENAKATRIDLAADYLLMASWLAYLKSRLMLPKVEAEEGDDASPQDMAQRLAFRLKRLDAMRAAGEELLDGPLLNNVVFLRGEPEQPKIIKHTEFSATLYELTNAFGTIRERKEKAAPHRVEKQFVLPLEAARKSLKSILGDLVDWQSLDVIRRQVVVVEDELPPRSVTASVFSAALELARDGDVDVRQSEHFTPLYLRGIPASEGKGVAHEPA